MTQWALGFAVLVSLVASFPADASQINLLSLRDLRASLSTCLTSGSIDSNGSSANPSLSADGRFAAFNSVASNLVGGDTDNATDLFLYDRVTQQTSRVSVAPDGSETDIHYLGGLISGDGRYVAFASEFFGGGHYSSVDMLVHDHATGETTLVTTRGGFLGASYPSISADGRFIAFEQYFSVYIYDRLTGATTAFGNDLGTPSIPPALSADARFAAIEFAGRVVVHDRVTRETTTVSVASDGTIGNSPSSNPAISADGQFVAFGSSASNLIVADTNDSPDVFVHDRATGETTRVSVANSGTEGNDGSYSAAISADGQFVAFSSNASNLIIGDTNVSLDVFVHDRITGETSRVSVASDGTEGNQDSLDPSISRHGRYVAFSSDATNLVSGDTNSFKDVFIHDRLTGETSIVSSASMFWDVTSAHWACDYINALWQAGLASGFPDGTYRPGNTVTRADMAVFLKKGIHGSTYSPPTPDGSHPFGDISGHWAEAWIEDLYDEGFTSGFPDGTYRPDNQVTRAEMAVFLKMAIHGSGYIPPSPDGSHPFSDIAGHWAEAWMEDLYDEGITSGYPDGTYRPENQVTRAEMAVFLVNAFSLPLP